MVSSWQQQQQLTWYFQNFVAPLQLVVLVMVGQ
jgi:hypothetical protein